MNARAIALAASSRGRIGGVRDVVPTFRSVAVYFDPLHTDGDALTRREQQPAGALPDATAPRNPVRIPVCYGGAFGPDLEDVARFAGMPPADVIALHTAPHLPRGSCSDSCRGLPISATVDRRIATPRRATARVRVPAGSVGIAGVQTGVYPAETPGGWQLIGRTPIKPFDPDRAEPFLMKAGDAVQFYPSTPMPTSAFTDALT